MKTWYLSANAQGGDGSAAAPFGSLAEVFAALHAADKTKTDGITVEIAAGTYPTHGATLAAAQSGTPACPVRFHGDPDGEVRFAGEGLSLAKADFRPVSDPAVLARLNPNAQGEILAVDLTAYGYTAGDFGMIPLFGRFGTEEKYDVPVQKEDSVGLIYRGERARMARWPSKGFTRDYSLVRRGESYEYFPEGERNPVKNPQWDTIRNPEGDTYQLGADLAKRVAGWKGLDDVRMHGFFRWEWADSSTPIASFDPDTGTLKTAFVERYGADGKGHFYFYNVLEELTEPGEFYLDRTAGILYFCFDRDSDEGLSVMITNSPTLSIENASDLTFENITFRESNNTGVTATGDRLTFAHCRFCEVGDYGIRLNGNHCLVSRCDIVNTGTGGVWIEGGDRLTLTPSGNLVENCTIHRCGRVSGIYNPAIQCQGIGNRCAHNEIFDLSHSAIIYGGNDHLLEYNHIHDICKITSDAGAIYAGRRWDWYGTVIRYNLIENLGGNGFTPHAIYFDDALAGQTAYGNILVNIPSGGQVIGGGRDNTVVNNIYIHCGMVLYYDYRARHVITDGWGESEYGKTGSCYRNLNESPWQSEVWQEHYPVYRRLTADYDNPDNPDSFLVPTGNTIDRLLVFGDDVSVGCLEEGIEKFSPLGRIVSLPSSDLAKFFVDAAAGDYRFRQDAPLADILPDFEPIPVEQIGIKP